MTNQQSAKRRRLMSGPDGFNVSTMPTMTTPRFQNAFHTTTNTPSRKPPAFHTLDPMLSNNTTTASIPTSKIAMSSTLPLSRPSMKLLKPPRLPVFEEPSTPQRPRSPSHPAPSMSKKPMKIPALPKPSTNTTIALKRYAPPSIQPTKNPPSPKQLKPLSTTSFAVATDLTTEGGAVGIAAILLKDTAGDDGAGEDDIYKSVRRGVHASPQKVGSKVKHLRYSSQVPVSLHNIDSKPRGGLADEASSILNNAVTSHTLWKMDVARLLSEPTSRERGKPDLVLKISTIIHDLHRSTSTLAVPQGIAFCCAPTSSMFVNKSYLLVLSFSPSPIPTTTPLQNPLFFHEGSEVWLWKPWCTVALSIQDIAAPESLKEDWDATTLLSDRFALFPAR